MHRQDCMLFVHATNTVLCFQIVELCVFSLVMRTVSTAPDKDVVIQSQLLKRCMHSVDRSYIMCLSRCRVKSGIVSIATNMSTHPAG